MRGVVAGKFWPMHKGHELLLNRAAQGVDHLDILLVAQDYQFPSPQERALAIYETIKGDITVHIVGDINTIDSTEESSQIWAKYTPAILGYIPDIVYSSEEYGVRWAGYMGIPHVMVDIERRVFPISGTEVRENYSEASKYLPPVTKAQVLPRVVVMGSESTGTTTLANALGKHYNTVVVPEYGRLLAERYKEENGIAPPLDYWTEQVFRLLVHGQNAMEERMAREANGLLICDTDSLASAVWYERYNGKKNSLYFDQVGLKQADKHSLYIITDYKDVSWEDDGTRDGENERSWMQESFLWLAKSAQRRYGSPVVLVSGTQEERLVQAIEAVEKVLDKHPVSMV